MGQATREHDMPEEGRALLTEREREILSGEADVGPNYRNKVRSVVRKRVERHFGDDVALLREHFPEVYDELERELCDTTDTQQGPETDNNG